MIAKVALFFGAIYIIYLLFKGLHRGGGGGGGFGDGDGGGGGGCGGGGCGGGGD